MRSGNISSSHVSHSRSPSSGNESSQDASTPLSTAIAECEALRIIDFGLFQRLDDAGLYIRATQSSSLLSVPIAIQPSLRNGRDRDGPKELVKVDRVVENQHSSIDACTALFPFGPF